MHRLLLAVIFLLSCGGNSSTQAPTQPRAKAISSTAEQGDIAALNAEAAELSKKGGDEAFQKAAALYEKACSAKDVHACRERGYLSLYGLIPAPAETAAPWFDKACKLGDHDACVAHARIILHGDREAGLEGVFESACKAREFRGCFAWAKVLKERGAEDEVVRLLEQGYDLQIEACQDGNGKACFDLAADQMYKIEDKANPQESARKAFMLLQHGCTAGDAEACAGSAQLLHVEDPTNTQEIAEKACKDGSGLGCSLRGSIAMESGDAEARQQWLSRGCELGNGRACALIATGHMMSANPEVSFVEVLGILDRSCRLRHPPGCLLRAELEMRSNASNLEHQRLALALLETACEPLVVRGCGLQSCLPAMADACVAAAMHYERGLGVEESAERRSQLLERACKLGKEDVCGGNAPDTTPAK